MILQNLILPQAADTAKMYAVSEKIHTGFPINLRKEESVSFAAFFNYFSLSKWKKYTSVKDVYVFIKCEGKFNLSIDHHVLDGEYEKASNIFSFESDGDADVKLPALPEAGLLSISVTSLSDNSALFGGGFRTEAEPQNNIKMAVNICTYRREKEIEEKIGTLLPAIGPAGNLYGNVEIFIVDNGNTLGSELNSEKIHIIPNKNLGGSGGFSRGMTEIMSTKRFTHILMNDDDASFDPESLYRTRSFLSFLKEEYRDAQIGGAMITDEEPNAIYESGASYTERGLFPKKKGLNVGDTVGCLVFDVEDEIDYFGWWYLVMPISRIDDIGYPLPLFIKEDDVEYGIRKRSSAMITLNGVSVRHGSFESKFSVSNYYYYARNRLAIGCVSGNLKRKDAAWMLNNALFEAICYRYGCAEMMLRGIKDFMKGPEFVFDHCSEGPVRPAPIDTGRVEELRKSLDLGSADMKRKGAGRRMLTMNGLLLPAKRNIETSAANTDSMDFYRTGKVLYNVNGTDGFIAERSVMRTLRIMFSAAGLRIRLLFSFGSLRKKYRDSRDRYSSEDNWKRLFGS